ncbi:aminotransferase class V-fold PLP-dependent enzyme [Roseomonas hellenica]|uniref:Aminotransferase class V-fold PLP-dependent enzyme n=1 Tax=Plastoroseomonas hellenica TaxID=2687306 RepID=A0ABS5F131_9PROT|nr:aminotransferase class V-fold PLP-dependent enzyme [Plastoroseomonas hellenica]MBR0666252.1 aminotransferase class V-fold PLP-dependent enzyme [Plastoroseomonas hellenica]
MNDGPDELLSPRTLAARGPRFQESPTRALTPPIDVATTYIRDADNGYPMGRVYGRSDNASVQHAEAQIAALENARSAMLFNSGMAAAAAVFMALDPTHVVVPTLMFRGLQRWLRGIGRHGHELTAIDMADTGAVRQAIRPGRTGLVWIETPSNPLWTITDIAAVAACAHDAGALVCADSTVATPVLTRPLDLGADIVMHSATKYLNGHSDVVAGVLAVRRPGALWSRIQEFRSQQGAVIGPFDAWLLARGLKTLDLRVREQSRSAALLAARLAAHPAIATVLYPGLPDHPGHDVARRQMAAGFGGMLSIRLRGGAAQAIGVAARVALWERATSFGGVESLIEHRASIEGADSPCPDDLLRLSVGLEDPGDLLRDLMQALEAAP